MRRAVLKTKKGVRRKKEVQKILELYRNDMNAMNKDFNEQRGQGRVSLNDLKNRSICIALCEWFLQESLAPPFISTFIEPL